MNFRKDPLYRRYPGLAALLRCGYRLDRRGLPVYRVPANTRIATLAAALCLAALPALAQTAPAQPPAQPQQQLQSPVSQETLTLMDQAAANWRGGTALLGQFINGNNDALAKLMAQIVADEAQKATLIEWLEQAQGKTQAKK